MKILSLPIILLLLSSCTKQVPDYLGSANSTIIVQNNESSTVKEVYINSVAYFPETAEFYVALNVKKGVEFDWVEVAKMTDSVTYQNDETIRKRLPLSIAKQYFDTNLLDTLEVFNYSHKMTAEVKLTRVECYEPNMESYFIAVFKAEKQLDIDDGPFY